MTSNVDVTAIINVGYSLSNIANVLNQYVVAPMNNFGIGGFVFNAVGEATANISADITDHYAEDNRAIQDQIAIRPKRITLKGYVGELIYTGNMPGQPAIGMVPQKLTDVVPYQPLIPAAAIQMQAIVANPSAPNFPTVLDTASNIYNIIQPSLNDAGSTQNQQNAYNYFKSILQSATLLGVQSPWEFMVNMAIESIIAVQPENSQWITDFSITLKEIRVASTSSTAQSNASASNGAPGTVTNTGVPAVLSTTAAIQQAPITNLGNAPGAPVTKAINQILNTGAFQ